MLRSRSAPSCSTRPRANSLVRNAGKPLSRERLLALARDDDAGERNDRAIDIAILRLRRVIEDDPKQPRWIQTVWGIGYRFSP
ncbi:hypothetical protein G6F52_013991 [Rhizopus delemar]|nr:hypothetical protein G6F52_013991 [Rhizopus delemar]